jgi:hypothetical protein
VPEIGTAADEAQARAAVGKYIDLAAKDAGVLRGVGKAITGEDVPTSELKDADGCATDKAVDLKDEIEGVLSTADMKPAEVPTDATNSGVGADGEMVQAAHPGISGNRRAVEVTIGKGENPIKRWIMQRCGNIAMRGQRSFPVGPTDQHEIPQGMSPKYDRNVTPDGVPNQNRGSGTSTHGPTGPGHGTSHPTGQGSSPGEEKVPAPAETPVATDTDSHTGPVDAGGAEIGGNQGSGNGSPEAPTQGVDPNNGNKGAQDPNAV